MNSEKYKIHSVNFERGLFMLKEKLMSDLKDAMKDKQVLKKNVVQMIRAAILQVEKDK